MNRSEYTSLPTGYVFPANSDVIYEKWGGGEVVGDGKRSFDQSKEELLQIEIHPLTHTL